MRDRIFNCVINAIESINETLPQKIHLQDGMNTPLFGGGGSLDSIGLVNLIVGIEEELVNEFNISITLTSEQAMSRSSSPFKTVSTLVDYIEELITKN